MSTILSKTKGHTSVEKNIIEETKEELDSEQEEMVLSPNQNYQINIINLPKSIYSLDETINQKIKNIKYEYESGLILNKLPVKDMLMEYKDFELHGKRANPIFARNLLNMINVINLIWLSVEKNVHTFHKMLKKYFNTKFSYLDDEFTDFVLAMPLQKATLMKVYEMSNPFPDITEQSILLNNLYLSLDKIKEYTLQEMSLSVLFSKTNINDYLTHSICEYPGHIVDLKIYECDYISGEFDLSIHSEYKWVNIEELLDYDLCDADVILSKFFSEYYDEHWDNYD